MIRPTLDDEHEDLIKIAIATQLFEADQVELLSEMMRSPSEQDVWLTALQDETPVGMAYMAPEKMTDGTWNLYLIAVHPDYQKQGHGKEILQYVEAWLVKNNQRILLVETAGVEDFSYVRKFYKSHGFEFEAQIRDFYEDKVDKIIFRKAILNQG